MKNKVLLLTLALFALGPICAQTQVQVTLWSGTTTTYEVANDGQLTFADGNLVVNATNVPLATIRKITFPKSVLAVNSVQADEQRLVVFPNPATDVLYVNNLKDENNAVTIYTIGGMMVKHATIANGEGLNVSGLAQGLYLLKVGNSVVKFSKQ